MTCDRLTFQHLWFSLVFRNLSYARSHRLWPLSMSCQASSVPCERLFSSWKHTASTDRQSCLGPEVFEQLQILKVDVKVDSGGREPFRRPLRSRSYRGSFAAFFFPSLFHNIFSFLICHLFYHSKSHTASLFSFLIWLRHPLLVSPHLDCFSSVL